MSGENTNFDDKKIKNCAFYKNKKINRIDDTDVNKKRTIEKEKNHTEQKIHLNTLLDVMIMILLDHYV